MKPKTYYVHVNKRSGHWTIHSSTECIQASRVIISAPCETVYKPLKKDNPRWFIKVFGVLQTIDFDINCDKFVFEIKRGDV